MLAVLKFNSTLCRGYDLPSVSDGQKISYFNFLGRYYSHNFSRLEKGSRLIDLWKERELIGSYYNQLLFKDIYRAKSAQTQLISQHEFRHSGFEAHMEWGCGTWRKMNFRSFNLLQSLFVVTTLPQNHLIHTWARNVLYWGAFKGKYLSEKLTRESSLSAVTLPPYIS